MGAGVKVRVVKPFRYGLRVFEVGEVVDVEYPLTFCGKPIFDLYVRFVRHFPIGVTGDEVEIIDS